MDDMKAVMNKRFLAVLWMLCVVCTLPAQEDDWTRTNILRVRFGSGYHIDTYLSPFAYTGLQYGLSNEWWQPFRQDSRLGETGRLAGWGHVGRISLTGYNCRTTARSNTINGLHVEAGWGAFYCWKWLNDRLQLHLGPYLEASFGARNIGSNVNKPLSFDIAAELMGMTGISWSFYSKKTSYRLNYLLRTNLIGFDYLPEYWQSYYEIEQGSKGMARCSGHWNHHTLKHELMLDMQFPHTTWRLGAEHVYTDYGTASQRFMSHSLSIVLGCIWQYKLKSNSRL